jgi:ribosomal-protein-alanine N-acetyltransferase
VNPFKQPFISPLASLETARLSIRIDTEESYIERFRISSDEELMAWTGSARPEDLETQKLKVAGGFNNYRTSMVFFHLIEKASSMVIGSIAFHNWYQMHGRSELGYGMTSEAHRNQGFMREALPEVLRFGFEAMDLNRIEAFISPENEPSMRLVERAGFMNEGLLRQHYFHNGKHDDSIVYGLLHKDWEAWGIGRRS